MENMQKSFPTKSQAELEYQKKQFYRNLCDLIVETIKVLSLSEKELNRRVSSDITVPASYLEKGQGVIALAGHLCNWEWLLLSCSSKTDKPVLAVYKPLHNKFFDKLMLKIRTRFGALGVPANSTVREVAKRRGTPFSLAMVADQTPGGEFQYWGNFLNQDTAFFIGGDKIAKMGNMPVFFVGMRRQRRGFYQVYFELIAEPPYAKDGFEIIEGYHKKLEQAIIENPSDWLWSHRRWKHKRVTTSV